MNRISLTFVLIAVSWSGWTQASGDVSQLEWQGRDGLWSLGLSYRLQNSPYVGESLHTDLLPMISYSGETWFLDGSQGGVHLLEGEEWWLDLVLNYRFDGYNDEDSAFLNGMERKSAWDGGLELNWLSAWGEWRATAVTDVSDRHQGQELALSWGVPTAKGAWRLKPWIGASWLSDDLSNYYYGVRGDEALVGRPAYKPGDVVQMSAGLDLDYRLARHHYFSLNLEAVTLPGALRRSPIIDDDYQLQAALIYRYEFNDDLYEPPAVDWSASERARPRFVRVAAGCGTEASMNQIMRFQRLDCEERHTGIVSLFIGEQLSDTFFGFPWEIWVKGGLVRHFERGEQDDFNEYVLAIKTYFRQFPWSDVVETRFGFAEGLSYAASIPTLERENVESKNRSTSNLLNYLDWSLDVNVNDLIGRRAEKPCYVGFSIHHRSGIFGSADFFGNVDGGSNFNTLYLECQY